MIMEHYAVDTNVRALQIEAQQKDKTLFVVENQGLQWYSTRSQCEEQAKKIMKDFNPKQYLAQKIVKYRAEGRDHLYAVLYKDFSKNHDRSDIADKNSDILYLGRLEMGVTKKMTDGNERSESFKDRIDATEQVQMPDMSIRDAPILKEVGYYSYLPATKQNHEILKATIGIFPKGHQTEFVFSLFNGGRNISVHSEEEFFEMTIEQAQQVDIQKQRLKEKEKLSE